jgi:hypothetical protein
VKGAEVWHVEVYFGQTDESMAGQHGRKCEDLFLLESRFFANFSHSLMATSILLLDALFVEALRPTAPIQ